MTEIVQGRLWVGSVEEAFDETVLRNVTHIVNVASELVIKQRADHKYFWRGVGDDDPEGNITTILEPCAGFIEEALREGTEGGRESAVLVHCLEGKSRSVCVVLYYICTRLRRMYDAEEVLKHVKERRSVVDIYWQQTIEHFNQESV
ncbi:hypothetical protein QOT17_009225 [Balamuthia mandrillaris]